MARNSSRSRSIALRLLTPPGVGTLTLRRWAGEALEALRAPSGELTIVIAPPAESKKLNYQYRKKKYATNVLTFPYETSDALGDIILCPAVIRREAKEQGRAYREYLRFLIQHGCIHLLGLDHHTRAEQRTWDVFERRLNELH